MTTSTAPRANLSRLMTFAWKWARQRAWSTRAGKPSLYLSEALKAAWANERSILAVAARQTALRPAQAVRADILDLETRTTLDGHQFTRLSALSAELRAAA
jgi:hypothetical protein